MLTALIIFIGLSHVRTARRSESVNGDSSLQDQIEKAVTHQGPFDLPTSGGSDTKESKLPKGRRFPLTKLFTVVYGASGKNASNIEKKFKQRNILLEYETVHFVWKTIRDYIVLCDRRVVRIDKKGLFGVQQKYESFLLSKLVKFAIQTKGTFDLTSELLLWFLLPPSTGPLGIPQKNSLMKIKLKPGTANLLAVNQFLSEKILVERDFKGPSVALKLQKDLTSEIGEFDEYSQDLAQAVLDKGKQPEGKNKSASSDKGPGGSKNLVQRFIGSVPWDPEKVEASLKKADANRGPLLLPDESVRAAYLGVRDYLVFTDRRILIKDKPAISALAATQYKSFPYGSLVGFAIQTAAAVLDFNTEITLYTEKETFEHALAASVDIKSLQNIVASIVLGGKNPSMQASRNQKNPSSFLTVDSQKLSRPNFLALFVGSKLKDPEKLTQQLHSGPTDILLPEERVVRGLKSFRDYFIITTHRVLVIDIKGATGAQVQYRTVVPDHIAECSVTTAGKIDLDGEVALTVNNGDKEEERVAKGTDLVGIQMDLAETMLRSAPAVKHSPLDVPAQSVLGGVFGGFVGGSGKLDALLHNGDTNILFQEESVHAALEGSVGLNTALVILTSKRLLLAFLRDDRGPISKVEYKSISYHNIRFFLATALAGHQDGITQLNIATRATHQDLTFSFGAGHDFPKFQKMLAERVLKRDEESVARHGLETLKQPTSIFAGVFGGYLADREQTDLSLHKPPFDILYGGETVQAAYKLFSQSVKTVRKTDAYGQVYLQRTPRSDPPQLFVLTQTRMLLISEANRKVQINSAPYTAIDSISMSPGTSGLTVGAGVFRQTALVHNANLKVRTATYYGYIVNKPSLRSGQNITDLSLQLVSLR